MLDGPGGPRSASTDLSARRQIALERIQHLIADTQERARLARRNYFTVQALTVGLAAITPCLIVLAKETPNSWILNWLQLFVPAFAAIAAGVSHIFHWREDSVRYINLAEAIRSQLWRFQTRSGAFAPELTDDQALAQLVVAVDELNLQSIARWSSAELAEAPAASGSSAQSGSAAAR